MFLLVSTEAANIQRLLWSMCHSIGAGAQKAIECWYSGWISQRTAPHRGRITGMQKRWYGRQRDEERRRSRRWTRRRMCCWLSQKCEFAVMDQVTNKSTSGALSLNPGCHLTEASNENFWNYDTVNTYLQELVSCMVKISKTVLALNCEKAQDKVYINNTFHA